MKIVSLIAILLTLIGGAVCAQDDPHGQIDTVFIDPVSVGAGQDFSVSVKMWNDEELGGITIPLVYPKDKMDYIGVDFTGSRLEYLATKPVTAYPADGKLLVGAIVFFEDYIQPGRGLLFKINFHLHDGVNPGEVFTIDSTQIPPAYLLLTGADASNIFPVFRKGQVTVASPNRPPSFVPIPELYVAEGDSLNLQIEAVDPEGDDIILANPIHPYSSKFVDNGDGTGLFSWVPDFVGPLSADRSPFSFVFWASDGEASSYTRVKVNVINVNRPPQIILPPPISAEAGDSLGISVSAFDPDFEDISWQILDLPNGATFDFENPGFINWVTDYGDSGQYAITLIATDPYGLADTAQLSIELLPVTLFSLRIDTLTTYSGRTVDVDVFLKNKPEIKEFNLLIQIDPGVLTVESVSRFGSRISDFGYFDYRINDNNTPGYLRVRGRADGADPLPAGDGKIFSISLQVSSDLNYVGQSIPLTFKTIFGSDNTLTLTDGTVITYDQINLFNGYLLIGGFGDRVLGDINLNGIAFEISDAVYFSNFFVSPGLYPLNDQQLLNSDINVDGFAPSIADLVMLIRVITGETNPPVPKLVPLALRPVKAELQREQDGLYLAIDAPVDLGGAWFNFGGPEAASIYATNYTDMEMMSKTYKGTTSCLLISYDNKVIASGEQRLIKLSEDADLDVYLDRVDVADVSGHVLEIEKKETDALPSSFSLYQNSPNPFNPTTEIRFDLDSPAHVSLVVYNVLGQEVITLADRDYPAGSHSVTWDGADNANHQVASGVYFYRIKAADHSASRKMVLLK